MANVTRNLLQANQAGAPQPGLSQRALTLLTENPAGNEIARAIAIDFLLPFGLTKVQLCALRSDDSLLFIGDYGHSPSKTNLIEPSANWRARSDAIRQLNIESTDFGFNDELTSAAAKFKVRGVTVGAIALSFATALTTAQAEEVAQLVNELILPLTIFFFIHPEIPGLTLQETSPRAITPAVHSDFTARQLKVLREIARGCTNHEIASALDFSVSTIRHETMRIFAILGVSSRHEAASKAQALQLI